VAAAGSRGPRWAVAERLAPPNLGLLRPLPAAHPRPDASRPPRRRGAPNPIPRDGQGCPPPCSPAAPCSRRGRGRRWKTGSVRRRPRRRQRSPRPPPPRVTLGGGSTTPAQARQVPEGGAALPPSSLPKGGAWPPASELAQRRRPGARARRVGRRLRAQTARRGGRRARWMRVRVEAKESGASRQKQIRLACSAAPCRVGGERACQGGRGCVVASQVGGHGTPQRRPTWPVARPGQGGAVPDRAAARWTATPRWAGPGSLLGRGGLPRSPSARGCRWSRRSDPPQSGQAAPSRARAAGPRSSQPAGRRSRGRAGCRCGGTPPPHAGWTR